MVQASVTRALGQSEKRDIVSHTEHLLARLKERSNNDINGISSDLTKASEYATKATIRLIYVGFGFRIMHEHMPNEKAWKTFVKKFFPNEVSNADRYVVIGKHFRYDDSYLSFLVGCDYAVPPQEFDRKRNIGSQLEELRKKGLSIRCPGDLLDIAKKGFIPEIADGKKRSSTNGHSISGDSPVDAAESPQPESEPVDAQAFVFNGMVSKLLASLTPLSLARSIFKAITETRPIEEWDKAEIHRLKVALRPAKEILDELFEA